MTRHKLWGPDRPQLACLADVTHCETRSFLERFSRTREDDWWVAWLLKSPADDANHDTPARLFCRITE
eukprot:Em0194g6a